MTTTIGKRIAAARVRAKLTGKELGEHAQVSAPWIRAVENGGIRQPAPDKLRRVASVLGLDERELLALTDQLGAAPLPVAAPSTDQSDVAAAIERQTTVLEGIARTLSELVGALTLRDESTIVAQVVAELRATVPALSAPGVSIEPPARAVPRRGRK